MCYRFKQKMKAQVIFLNPFTVCLSCKRKVVLCLFVGEETAGNYPQTDKWTKRTCPSMPVNMFRHCKKIFPTFMEDFTDDKEIGPAS